MTIFFERVISLVRKIPKGKVMTYGGVARSIGFKGSARYVSYILKSSSRKYDLPWHRVINSKGKISPHGHSQKQKKLLRKEGVAVTLTGLPLEEFEWEPSQKLLKQIISASKKTRSR